jgi:two-component system OmpR family response regulator
MVLPEFAGNSAACPQSHAFIMSHQRSDFAREAPVHLQAFVIEDNATIRENLIGTLEELTCVRVAGASATEEEAMAWLAQNQDAWDLVIVDLFLKQGSGIHLAQSIQRSRPMQKIIVFSNYINASVRKRCAQLGVDAVFDKSTEIDSLVDYCAHQCYRVSQSQAAAA